MTSEFVTKIIGKYAPDEALREIITVHSSMVAAKALSIVKARHLEGEVDLQFLEDAAMLHDIGIVEVDAPSIHCHGSRPYICHGLAGAEILAREGLPEAYQRVCLRHTGAGITAREIRENRLPLPEIDLLPETLEERLICYADKFFSKSRDLRYEKTMEEAERSVRKFGEESYGRFLSMKNEFE